MFVLAEQLGCYAKSSLTTSTYNYTLKLSICQVEKAVFEIIRTGGIAENKGVSMEIRKPIGRKPKVTYTTMLKLSDAIQHNSSIVEACRWAGSSTTTFFYYMRNNGVFKEKMLEAKQNQTKVVFSFFTLS